jgi:hypothetical protein
MTSVIFEDWFRNEFVPSVREFSANNSLEPKAVLVLDNFSGHVLLESEDGLIRCLFLPPNVTSIGQPMDQSPINALKSKYKKKLSEFLILNCDKNMSFPEWLKKVNLLTSVEWIAESWKTLKVSTIRNSWNKIGLDWLEPDGNESELAREERLGEDLDDDVGWEGIEGEGIREERLDGEIDDDVGWEGIEGEGIREERLDEEIDDDDEGEGIREERYDEDESNCGEYLMIERSDQETDHAQIFRNAMEGFNSVLALAKSLNATSEEKAMLKIQQKLIDKYFSS